MVDETKVSEDVSSDIFKQELQTKVSTVFNDDKVKRILDATTKYFGINNTSNGKEFFKQIILEAPKDYPNVSSRFFQALTELKSRLGRLFDDTIAYQKLNIEQEMIEIEIEEMTNKTVGLFSKKMTRKDELNIELKKQELLQKKVKIAFAKDSLNSLEKDIADFTSICDEYMATGEVVPYELARLEEMAKKKKMLFLAHVMGNKKELTPSELAFFMQEDGTIRPPEGIEEDLKRLGHEGLALQVEFNRKGIDGAKQMRLENKVPESSGALEHDSIRIEDGK